MLRANPRTLFPAATTCSLRDTEASGRISVLFACPGLAGRRLQGHFCRPLDPAVPSAPAFLSAPRTALHALQMAHYTRSTESTKIAATTQ